MKKSISLIVVLFFIVGCTYTKQKVKQVAGAVGLKKETETVVQEEVKVTEQEQVEETTEEAVVEQAVISQEDEIDNVEEAKVWFDKGIKALEVKDYDRAILCFKTSAVKNPNDPKGNFSLGMVYLKLGRLDEASSEFNKVLTITPNNAETHYRLGQTYDRQGRIDKAALEYKKCIEMDSNHADAHYNLGIIYHEGGLYNKAALEFYKAAEVNPNYAWSKDPFEWYNKGVNAENFNGKIKYYKQAIAINPQFAEAYYNLGVLYGKKDMIDEAMDEYKKTIEISPDHADAYLNLGYLYSEKRLYGLAAEYYYQAGLLYLKQGNREGAVTAYNNLKAIPAKKLEQALFEKLYPELKQKKSESSK